MPETLWLCWTNNCRGHSDHGLYIIHAIGDAGIKTLCGCWQSEVGERVTEENQPSCKRCLRVLKNRA